MQYGGLAPILQANFHPYVLRRRTDKSEDAFDVIAELSYGQQLGFLDQGIDVNNLMQTIEEYMDRNAPVSNPSSFPLS